MSNPGVSPPPVNRKPMDIRIFSVSVAKVELTALYSTLPSTWDIATKRGCNVMRPIPASTNGSWLGANIIPASTSSRKWSSTSLYALAAFQVGR
mmetsp:Transcript_6275/g.8586  ORF Transcript_6275/g.8586 Transcript_6275/m.8586 type:complete len:94 (-) Transcript_6275:45-326(-)